MAKESMMGDLPFSQIKSDFKQKKGKIINGRKNAKSDLSKIK